MSYGLIYQFSGAGERVRTEHIVCNQRHFQGPEKDFRTFWWFAALNAPNAQETQLGPLLYIMQHLSFLTSCLRDWKPMQRNRGDI